MNTNLSRGALWALVLSACTPAESSVQPPNTPADVAAPAAPPATAVDALVAEPPPDSVLQVLASVTVKNPTALPRANESIVLDGATLGGIGLSQVHVLDETGQAVLSQILNLPPSAASAAPVSQLLFQVTLGAGQTQTYRLVAGPQASVAPSSYLVYGRFVRERFDDFVWENDQLASRVYGPALEAAGKEALTSSGVDAWVKRVPRLVVNNWYMTGDYHADSGEGGDFYSVGKSRGCGGTGIWEKDKLYVSKNFAASRVLANGPLRLVFELDYAAWSAAGVGSVAETKRITLDAHSSFNRIETHFKKANKQLAIALGIAKHPGSAAEYNLAEGWLRAWEPLGAPNGNLGCAVLVPGAADLGQAATETDSLLTAPVNKDGTLTYYTGFVWDGNGRVLDAKAWDTELKASVERFKQPLVVAVSPTTPAPVAAPAAPAAP